MPKRIIKNISKKDQLIALYSRGDISIREAAERLKMNYTYAREILAKPDNLNKVEEKMEQRAAKAEVDALWVLKKYIHISEVCSKTYKSKGGPAKCVDPQAANKALEMIARHTGGFVEKGAEKPQDIFVTVAIGTANLTQAQPEISVNGVKDLVNGQKR